MGILSSSYEPGGRFHVRITDETFDEARNLVTSDLDRLGDVIDKDEKDLIQYEAHDFPVREILASFFLAYNLQEAACGIPENGRLGNLNLGRKERLECDQFIDRFNRKLERKDTIRREAWQRKGFGEALFSMAASAAAKGVAKAVTGKAEDVRQFEKYFLNYICGDSPKAKEFFLRYAVLFGGTDEGLCAVASRIRGQFWLAEFARRHRNIVPTPVASRAPAPDILAAQPSQGRNDRAFTGPAGVNTQATTDRAVVSVSSTNDRRASQVAQEQTFSSLPDEPKEVPFSSTTIDSRPQDPSLADSLFAASLRFVIDDKDDMAVRLLKDSLGAGLTGDKAIAAKLMLSSSSTGQLAPGTLDRVLAEGLESVPEALEIILCLESAVKADRAAGGRILGAQEKRGLLRRPSVLWIAHSRYLKQKHSASDAVVYLRDRAGLLAHLSDAPLTLMYLELGKDCLDANDLTPAAIWLRKSIDAEDPLKTDAEAKDEARRNLDSLGATGTEEAVKYVREASLDDGWAAEEVARAGQGDYDRIKTLGEDVSNSISIDPQVSTRFPSAAEDPAFSPTATVTGFAALTTAVATALRREVEVLCEAVSEGEAPGKATVVPLITSVLVSAGSPSTEAVEYAELLADAVLPESGALHEVWQALVGSVKAGRGRELDPGQARYLATRLARTTGIDQESARRRVAVLAAAAGVSVGSSSPITPASVGSQPRITNEVAVELMGRPSSHLGDKLREALRSATAGAEIRLLGGEFEGPFEITQAVKLRGQGDATTLWMRRGPVVVVKCDGVALQDLLIEATEPGGVALFTATALEPNLSRVTVKGGRESASPATIPSASTSSSVARQLTAPSVWVVPAKVDFGTIAAGSSVERFVDIETPGPATVVCSLSGIRAEPTALSGGRAQLKVTVDGAQVVAGGILTGDLEIVSGTDRRTISVFASIAASAPVATQTGSVPSSSLTGAYPQVTSSVPPALVSRWGTPRRTWVAGGAVLLVLLFFASGWYVVTSRSPAPASPPPAVTGPVPNLAPPPPVVTDQVPNPPAPPHPVVADPVPNPPAPPPPVVTGTVPNPSAPPPPVVTDQVPNPSAPPPPVETLPVANPPALPPPVETLPAPNSPAPQQPVETPPVLKPPAPPSPPYQGPMGGTLTYSGPRVVQNGDIVFRNLPPLPLRLTYDEETWDARLTPGEGNTQRLILRNKKPGTQTRCIVVWRVIQ